MRIIFNSIDKAYGPMSESTSIETVRFLSVEINGVHWLVLVNISKPDERGRIRRFNSIIFKQSSNGARTLTSSRTTLHSRDATPEQFIKAAVMSDVLIFDLDEFSKDDLDHFSTGLTVTDLSRLDEVIPEVMERLKAAKKDGDSSD